MCAAASDVLTTLGFTDFTIRLNHRRLLTQMLTLSGLPENSHGAALVVIDKLDKVGRENVIAELVGVVSGNVNAGKMLDMFLMESVLSNEEKLQRLRRYFENSLVPADVLDDLAALLKLSEQTSAADHMRLDPSLARGLSYYTGAIMEITVPDLPGSLGGGGRYDNLIGLFLGRDVPACGFSFGLERILVVMDERTMFPESVAGRSADVMVTLWNQQSESDAIALAGALRRERLRVDVYPEPDKLGKQFKYASSRNIPFVIVIGDDEKAAGTATVKDLRIGEQQTIARSDAPSFIRERLSHN